MKIAVSGQRTILDYISVLKPKETILLTFIGVCSAIVAGGAYLPGDIFVVTLVAIGLGCAGCNGLTNYLDREVDARMMRTANRALPAGRIVPAQKVLPLIICLLVAALVLAWLLHPLCFVFGLIGIVASAMWRKTASCTFLGIVAGCSPLLIGWFAISPEFDIRLLFLCSLVALWIPIHVWSVMVASRNDYLRAGLSYFPLNLSVQDVVRVLFVLSIFLYLVSILLYFVGEFRLIYLITANILGILIIYATASLLLSRMSTAAWRVYKLSAFPYLGVIFLAMCLDVWLL